MTIRIILMIGVLILCIPSNVSSASDTFPIATQGELDVSSWDWEQNGIVPLNGEWEFVWQKLLTPDELKHFDSSGTHGYIQVPKVWGGQAMNGQALSNKGYGTYRLRIKLPSHEVGNAQALMMPSVATAYRLWINGDLAASNGVVGTSLQEMKAQNHPKPVYFTPLSNEVEIVIQVSNYVQRKGGLWSQIEMGRAELITSKRENNIIVQMTIAGALLIIGLHHIGLFAFRRIEKSSLFFGLACLFICVRTLLVGDILWFRLWPNFNWEIAVKLEYLSPFIGIGFFMLYTYHLYPEDMRRNTAYLFFTMICFICLPIIFLPARIYTLAMVYYQLVLLCSLMYIMYVVLKAVLRKRKGAWVSGLALFIFVIAVINDILYYNHFVHTGDWVGFGLFTFIFAQTLVLASRFSLAFSQVEQLSGQLAESNRSLEHKVKERTKELEELNADLKENISIDGLTNIRNRRFFNEIIYRVWEDSIREPKPVSLFLIDIDYFKLFNDFYGHQAGDKCLIQVAQALERTIHHKGFVTRYGGEEFAIILPNTALKEARMIGEILRSMIEHLKIPNEKSEVSQYVTISIGLSSALPRDTQEIEHFINQADTALYQSKSSGRNRVSWQVNSFDAE